jgi:hypothetical protein
VTCLISTMERVVQPGSEGGHSGEGEGEQEGKGEGPHWWRGSGSGSGGGAAAAARTGAPSPVSLRVGLGLALRRIVNIAGVREEVGLPVRARKQEVVLTVPVLRDGDHCGHGGGTGGVVGDGLFVWYGVSPSTHTRCFAPTMCLLWLRLASGLASHRVLMRGL